MRKYLIIALIACLAVFLITSPSVSRLPGEVILPERSTAPPSSTNTNKIYNLNDVTTIVDEDGNTIAISPAGVSNHVTTLSTNTTLTEIGFTHVTGARVIILPDPADWVGTKGVISGDTSGTSIWLTQAGSLNEIGTASGATLSPTTAPWMVELIPMTGACTFVNAKVGTFNTTPE